MNKVCRSSLPSPSIIALHLLTSEFWAEDKFLRSVLDLWVKQQNRKPNVGSIELQNDYWTDTDFRAGWKTVASRCSSTLLLQQFRNETISEQYKGGPQRKHYWQKIKFILHSLSYIVVYNIPLDIAKFKTLSVLALCLIIISTMKRLIVMILLFVVIMMRLQAPSHDQRSHQGLNGQVEKDNSQQPSANLNQVSGNVNQPGDAHQNSNHPYWPNWCLENCQQKGQYCCEKTCVPKKCCTYIIGSICLCIASCQIHLLPNNTDQQPNQRPSSSLQNDL